LHQLAVGNPPDFDVTAASWLTSARRQLFTIGTEADDVDPVADGRCGITGADGSFSFPNLPAGQYALTAAGPCSNTNANNMRARQLFTLLNPTEGLFYGAVDQAYLDATGKYNGLKIAVTKRLSHGWSTSANYTLSKCINQGEPGTDIGNSFPVPLIDPNTNPHPDASSNEGPCAADRRHLFNLSSVLISPGLTNNRIVRLVTKDWQMGVIVQARSGSTITPGITTSLSLQGGVARPNLVPGVDPYAAERKWVINNGVPSLTWFNPAAFAPDAPGVRGNVPKGYLVGPSFWNADAAFSRNINMSGGHRVEIRVEAFNLFNHANWGNPGISQGSNSLTNGNVTSTSGDPRIMQFALKYGF